MTSASANWLSAMATPKRTELEWNSITVISEPIQENANKKRTLEAASQRADALGGRGGQQTIQASFGKGDQEQLLDLAADFFYGCGLSFNVNNNPYFKAYIAGVSAAPPGHKPPSYYQLRVPLLARAKARLAPKLAAFFC